MAPLFAFVLAQLVCSADARTPPAVLAMRSCSTEDSRRLEKLLPTLSDEDRLAVVKYCVEEAARSGSEALLPQLLGLVAPDPSWWVPQYFAARQGNVALLERLLDAGYAADAVDDDHRTALFAAAEADREEVIDLLASRGARIDLEDDEGRTVWDVAEGPTRELLARHGAKPASDNLSPDERIARAIVQGDLATVDALWEHAFTIRAGGGSGLLRAIAERGHVDVATALVARGWTLYADFVGIATTPEIARRAGHAALARIIEISWDPDLTDREDEPRLRLFLAALDGDLAGVDDALAAGADPGATVTTSRLTAMHAAALADRPEAVRRLLDAGAPTAALDADLQSPLDLAGPRTRALLDAATPATPVDHVRRLLAAAAADDRAELEQARSEGADLATAAPGRMRLGPFMVPEGTTALHAAAITNAVQAIGLLLEAGVDPGAADANGDTPVEFAVRGDHLEAVQALAAAGAPITPAEVRDAALRGNVRTLAWLARRPDVQLDALTPGGTSALHAVAGLWPRIESVRVLLAAGARPDAPDSGGSTALCVAAGAGEQDIAGLLLEAGARVDPGGCNPLTRAVAAGHADLARALVAAGADPSSVPAGVLASSDADPRFVVELIASGAPLPPLTAGLADPLVFEHLHRGAVPAADGGAMVEAELRAGDDGTALLLVAAGATVPDSVPPRLLDLLEVLLVSDDAVRRYDGIDETQKRILLAWRADLASVRWVRDRLEAWEDEVEAAVQVAAAAPLQVTVQHTSASTVVSQVRETGPHLQTTWATRTRVPETWTSVETTYDAGAASVADEAAARAAARVGELDRSRPRPELPSATQVW